MDDYEPYANKVLNSVAPIKYALNILMILPRVGIQKIYVGAHIVPGSHVGLGAVARSTDGKLILAVVKRIEATWDVEVVEVIYVRFAIHLRKDLEKIEFGLKGMH